MTFQFDGYNWLVRLEKGELLVESLLKLVQQENLSSAWLSALGAAGWVELGFYELPSKTYRWKKFERDLEITSLQGNLAWDGEEPVWHIHGSFSDETMQVFGGHVKELEVAGTCEILLHRWYADKLQRKTDEAIGLKLLDL
jgi:predicted DNA-binding protein with PD1-like motif